MAIRQTVHALTGKQRHQRKRNRSGEHLRGIIHGAGRQRLASLHTEPRAHAQVAAQIQQRLTEHAYPHAQPLRAMRSLAACCEKIAVSKRRWRPLWLPIRGRHSCAA